MKLLYTLGPAVFLLALFACTPDQLEEADQLERTLLITWVALERNDFKTAAAYSEQAKNIWRANSPHYREVTLTSSQHRSLELLQEWMDNLDFAIRYGQRDKALNTIRLFQNEIPAIRPPGESVNPTDALYRFYLHWEEVREVSQDQMMCLLEWQEFEGLYETAVLEWEAYQRFPGQAYPEVTLPGLGSNSLKAEQYALSLSAALAEFALTLQQGDHTLTRQPGNHIHRLFTDYLAIIIDYPDEQSLK